MISLMKRYQRARVRRNYQRCVVKKRLVKRKKNRREREEEGGEGGGGGGGGGGRNDRKEKEERVKEKDKEEDDDEEEVDEETKEIFPLVPCPGDLPHRTGGWRLIGNEWREAGVRCEGICWIRRGGEEDEISPVTSHQERRRGRVTRKERRKNVETVRLGAGAPGLEPRQWVLVTACEISCGVMKEMEGIAEREEVVARGRGGGGRLPLSRFRLLGFAENSTLDMVRLEGRFLIFFQFFFFFKLNGKQRNGKRENEREKREKETMGERKRKQN